MICADEFVPEIARLTAMKGAQILFYISYEGDASRYMYGSNPVYDVAYATIPSVRAVENGMPVVQANAALLPQNVGTMGGSHGESHIVDKLGHVLQRGPLFGEALLVQSVEVAPAGGRYPRHIAIFEKMWQAGMSSVFSRMPIDMRAGS